MGMENDAMLSFLGDNERFADLFNYVFFEGKQVVRAKDLEDASENYVETKDKKGGTKSRDIKKKLKSGKELKILALESQSMVNYIMPLRCMDYDCREYGKQVKQIQSRNRKAYKEAGRKVYANDAEWLSEFRRDDRIKPVYTICLYHGIEDWDGPRCLRDMMDFEEGIANETDGALETLSVLREENQMWEKFFADYPLRLVCVNELLDYSGFRTSLRELFCLLPYRKDKEKISKIMEENVEFQTLDRETARTIGVLIGVDTFMKREEDYKNDGGYNMCQAIRELCEDNRMEGRAEGRAEGLSAGILAMIEDNLDGGASKDCIVKKLQKYFALSEEEAILAFERRP